MFCYSELEILIVLSFLTLHIVICVLVVIQVPVACVSCFERQYVSKMSWRECNLYETEISIHCSEASLVQCYLLLPRLMFAMNAIRLTIFHAMFILLIYSLNIYRPIHQCQTSPIDSKAIQILIIKALFPVSSHHDLLQLFAAPNFSLLVKFTSLISNPLHVGVSTWTWWRCPGMSSRLWFGFHEAAWNSGRE